MIARHPGAARRKKSEAVAERDISRAWQQFLETRDEIARRAIIEHYAYLVSITVARCFRRVPLKPLYDADDLRGAGYLGLVRAVDSFDPAKAAKFTVYAILLIAGAAKEFMRRQDPIKRTARNRFFALARMPRTEETSDALSKFAMDCQEPLSLSVPCNSEEDLLWEDLLEDPGPSLEEMLLVQEQHRVLFDALAQLPERQRRIIVMRAWRGATYCELGEREKTSSSNARRLYLEGKALLREQLRRNPLFQEMAR